MKSIYGSVGVKNIPRYTVLKYASYVECNMIEVKNDLIRRYRTTKSPYKDNSNNLFIFNPITKTISTIRKLRNRH